MVTKRAPRPVDSNLFEPSLIDIRKLVEVIEPYRAERLLSKTYTILNTPLKINSGLRPRSQFRHSRMLLAGIQANFGLDPRLKRSGVTTGGVVNKFS